MLFLRKSVQLIKPIIYGFYVVVFFFAEIDDGSNAHVSSVVWVLLMMGIIIGVGGWIFYAYRNPHTPSGQCFIRVNLFLTKFDRFN